MFSIFQYAHISHQTQRHLVKQPEKPIIYIINESAVFEKDGYLYYNLTNGSNY